MVMVNQSKKDTRLGVGRMGCIIVSDASFFRVVMFWWRLKQKGDLVKRRRRRRNTVDGSGWKQREMNEWMNAWLCWFACFLACLLTHPAIQVSAVFCLPRRMDWMNEWNGMTLLSSLCLPPRNCFFPSFLTPTAAWRRFLARRHYFKSSMTWKVKLRPDKTKQSMNQQGGKSTVESVLGRLLFWASERGTLFSQWERRLQTLTPAQTLIAYAYLLAPVLMHDKNLSGRSNPRLLVLIVLGFHWTRLPWWNDCGADGGDGTGYLN